MDTPIEKFLHAVPFFRALSNKDTDALYDASDMRIYTKGQSIFHQSDPADRFFVIVNGWIKLYRDTMDGEEAVIALFTRGDAFGEAVLADGAQYPYEAEAIEDAQIIEIPASILKEKAWANPDLSFAIMESMSHHIERLQLENEHLALLTTSQRVGCFLLQLCLGMNHCDGHLVFPYDKHLAAARLGMKPETFSRALKELQSIGVRVEKSDIYIESRERLEEYCCSSCSASPENCPLALKNACFCKNLKKTA